MRTIMTATAAIIAMAVATSHADRGGPIGDAIYQLNPRLSPGHVYRYADAVEQASRGSGIDPMLLVAIAHRESGWRPDVESGRVRGRLGELGIMQVMPRGAALRWAGGCRQTEAACSLRTAAGYLAWLRDEACQGSIWRWLGGYSRSRCPSEEDARRARDVLAARSIYCAISPDCELTWPE